MVGWHYQLKGYEQALGVSDGHEFEQTRGDSGEQRSLACYGPWGCKEFVMTQQLNNNNINIPIPKVPTHW